jgi:hypothetical protein
MGKRCPDVDPKKTDFMTENFDYRDQAEGIWYSGHIFRKNDLDGPVDSIFLNPIFVIREVDFTCRCQEGA